MIVPILDSATRTAITNGLPASALNNPNGLYDGILIGCSHLNYAGGAVFQFMTVWWDFITFVTVVVFASFLVLGIYKKNKSVIFFMLACLVVMVAVDWKLHRDEAGQDAKNIASARAALSKDGGACVKESLAALQKQIADNAKKSGEGR